METSSDIERLEAAFCIRLPPGYRQFLAERQMDLDTSLEIDVLESWPRGKTATVDGIYSVASLLRNNANGASCDPQERMLIIGYSLFGGYLYLSWDAARFGQIFFREPFHDVSYHKVANSFEDFMAHSRPVTYEDEI